MAVVDALLQAFKPIFQEAIEQAVEQAVERAVERAVAPLHREIAQLRLDVQKLSSPTESQLLAHLQPSSENTRLAGTGLRTPPTSPPSSQPVEQSKRPSTAPEPSANPSTRSTITQIGRFTWHPSAAPLIAETKLFQGSVYKNLIGDPISILHQAFSAKDVLQLLQKPSYQRPLPVIEVQVSNAVESVRQHRGYRNGRELGQLLLGLSKTFRSLLSDSKISIPPRKLNLLGMLVERQCATFAPMLPSIDSKKVYNRRLKSVKLLLQFVKERKMERAAQQIVAPLALRLKACTTEDALVVYRPTPYLLRTRKPLGLLTLPGWTSPPIPARHAVEEEAEDALARAGAKRADDVQHPETLQDSGSAGRLFANAGTGTGSMDTSAPPDGMVWVATENDSPDHKMSDARQDHNELKDSMMADTCDAPLGHKGVKDATMSDAQQDRNELEDSMMGDTCDAQPGHREVKDATMSEAYPRQELILANTGTSGTHTGGTISEEIEMTDDTWRPSGSSADCNLYPLSGDDLKVWLRSYIKGYAGKMDEVVAQYPWLAAFRLEHSPGVLDAVVEHYEEAFATHTSVIDQGFVAAFNKINGYFADCLGKDVDVTTKYPHGLTPRPTIWRLRHWLKTANSALRDLHDRSLKLWTVNHLDRRERVRALSELFRQLTDTNLRLVLFNASTMSMPLALSEHGQFRLPEGIPASWDMMVKMAVEIETGQSDKAMKEASTNTNQLKTARYKEFMAKFQGSFTEEYKYVQESAKGATSKNRRFIYDDGVRNLSMLYRRRSLEPTISQLQPSDDVEFISVEDSVRNDLVQEMFMRLKMEHDTWELRYGAMLTDAQLEQAAQGLELKAANAADDNLPDPNTMLVTLLDAEVYEGVRAQLLQQAKRHPLRFLKSTAEEFFNMRFDQPNPNQQMPGPNTQRYVMRDYYSKSVCTEEDVKLLRETEEPKWLLMTGEGYLRPRV
ncbi:hypothetical protein BU26DRAFT_501893 [Trematosphaeria pertusa]|uniref:Uncharacterized protein n=1 Tax=Trematosphaeria pertusa TaxID=390896 RepID=A0A6A6ITM6_9PLEO|nr:uncharacterized protein BU26DRAFT_501893 [Trematosphaeria pertusa]KAF2253756.1 hypothetical protein BU26DRAFT_501893 [Trematosphaeria pertusa]